VERWNIGEWVNHSQCFTLEYSNFPIFHLKRENSVFSINSCEKGFFGAIREISERDLARTRENSQLRIRRLFFLFVKNRAAALI